MMGEDKRYYCPKCGRNPLQGGPCLGPTLGDCPRRQDGGTRGIYHGLVRPPVSMDSEQLSPPNPYSPTAKLVPVHAIGDPERRVEPRLARPWEAPRLSKEEARDMVNLPGHYAQWHIEPIRFIVENDLDFMRGNAIKYIMRCRDKGTPEQDLNKARRYLDMFEDRVLKHDPDWWKPRSDTSRRPAPLGDPAL